LGGVRADMVVVNTDGADFVFAKNYRLRPLSEVESFIQANHHLPEIAPAAQMQAEGVSVGELQTQLLQKVEELTLYLIEQNKQLQEQKKESDTMKQQLQEQNQKVEEQAMQLQKLKKENEELKAEVVSSSKNK
jgi:ABC-type Na+ efflux pump permease subunit